MSRSVSQLFTRCFKDLCVDWYWRVFGNAEEDVCLWITDPHSRAPRKNTSHGHEVLPQGTTHLIQRPCYQRGNPWQDPAYYLDVEVPSRSLRTVKGWCLAVCEGLVFGRWGVIKVFAVCDKLRRKTASSSLSGHGHEAFFTGCGDTDRRAQAKQRLQAYSSTLDQRTIHEVRSPR